jgi:threonine dehydrogenase-like Zn-dependent dehydrogenase
VKAIVNTAPARLEWQDRPTPAPGPGQVRIRTRACGICATDLEMIAGWDRTACPAIPGHEWAGVVDAVGPGVDDAWRGRPCVGENVLADGGEVGFEHPGGYAEHFLTAASNLQALPPGLAFETATLIEPLAVCVRGLRRLGAPEPSRALLFGDGPVGLLLVLLLARRGAAVTLVGGRPARLALARELGAAATLNYHDFPDGHAALAQRAGGDFPVVIEASGSAAALEAALELGRGTRVLLLGDYGSARAAFPWNLILHRELTLIGSNASAGAWPEAVRLAGECAGTLARLVTHARPAAAYDEALALVRDRAAGAVKVVLKWEAL